MSVVEELSGDGSRIVTSWKRTTVADGDWLQHNTIGPLNERDVFLAEKIDELSGNSDEKLNEEIEARKNADTFLSGTIDTFSGNYETFKSKTEGNIDYLSGSIDGLKEDLDTEKEDRSREDGLLQAQIDTIKAASDVIMVYGTYNNFETNSASLTLTDNDVIKVLEDEHLIPPGQQVYYQYSENTETWTNIGELSPYYSKAEIDELEEQLSATIANTYLSANNTAVSAGKNIIVTNETGTKVGIKTKDDVSFSSVSATGFSGTNLSGASKNDSIDNLFGSAYSGAEASAWIYDNSARLDIQAGYGLDVGINDENHLSVGMKQYHCTAGGYDDYSLALGYQSQATAGIRGEAAFAFGYNAKAIGAEAFAAGYDSIANASWSYTMGNAVYAGQQYSVVLGFLNSANASGTYQLGRGLSSDNGGVVLGQWNEPLAGATLIVGDGTGTQIGHDVVRKNALVIKDGLVSARDFSAGNVSLSSLTNLSALGNGITNTATFNLSAVKLSAGEGIGFKNDTNGVLSISAEGRAYTGENYVKVDNTTKKIGLSGNIVGSAESGQSAYNWITGQSATLSAGFGIQFTSAATTAMGIKLDATINSDDKIASIGGKELVGGNDVKIVGLISGTNIDRYEYTGNITSISAFRTAGEMELETQGIVYSFKDNQDTNHSFYSIFVPSADSIGGVQYLATSGNGESRDYYWKDISIPSNYVQSSPANLTIVVGSTGTNLNTLYIY